MKFLINFAKGLRATGSTTRMVILLFAANLLFSLVLAAPMYRSLQESLDHSEAGERMARGFDYLWWEEFRDQSKGLETTFGPAIIGHGALLNNLEALAEMRLFALPPILLALGILYLIFRTVLAGGILSVFNQKRPAFSLKKFTEGAAAYFSRFLGLMLFSWLFFGAIGLLHFGFRRVLRDISQNAISEIEPFLFGLLFSFLSIFLLLFVQMAFDYARIKIVVDGRRNVLKTAFEAFGFVFRHPFSTLALYYLIVILHLGAAVIYVLLKGLIPQVNLPLVLGAFLLQQLFVFALLWLRCLFYSSQLELYRYLK